VDGALDPITSATLQVISTTTEFPLTLGGSSHASNYNFKGNIDVVRIFPRALSAAEINSLGATAAILAPAEGDPDGNGSSNSQEFIAETDPQDACSVFKITGFSTVGSDRVLTWLGQTGRIYQIEKSLNLSQWHPAPGTTPLVGIDGRMQDNVVITQDGEPTRFYRVRVELNN